MEFATGALGTLLPKLANLLHGEYKLQKNVRKNMEFLTKELELTQAVLHSVGEVPLEQLPELVKIWARDARELSYDMEDVVDTFLVRVQGPDPPSRRSSRKFIQKMKSMLTLVKRHQIGEQIKDIKERVMELAARRDRYMVHTINPVATTVDPRIKGLYAKATDLVGISKAKKELVMKLQQQMIVSIVGFGGLGKTTLAKAVYDEIKSQFDCTAFVTVSQNPDMRKFLKDMLYELGQTVYGDIHNRSLDERQLIDIARGFLHDKRYLIIIDDIWNTSHWDLIIKHALLDNNTGSKVITTTRNVTVANHIGCAYSLQPLSPDNSRVLLYRRIFGNEDLEKCLDENLKEVSDRILKKCAGVPLAIITIASLLASRGRNKAEWDEVCKSIGNGMENSLDAENMRKILSYSYYDLPSYLRTCLLYLSTFPEDYEIAKDRLIWLWIAECFIQHGKDWKKSLFELGESYFNELINRSMIQSGVRYYALNLGERHYCRVHDMVLDLIRSISSEEGFVTILSTMDQNCPSSIARRLSLQNGKMDHAMTQTTQSMSLVRSIIVFPSALDQMPALRSFKMLRVLDLGGCDLSKDYSLQYLGSLFHLRYLSLQDTGIVQLPTAVGNLQFLEIFDVSDNRIDQLPECVAQLTHLLCLSLRWNTRVSNGIGSLTSLEELTELRIDDQSRDTIEGLGLLTELRVLSIWLFTDKWTDKLVESLCNLQKIQSLSIFNGDDDDEPNLVGLDGWVPSPELRRLEINEVCWFLRLPVWINNHTQFQDLAYLYIGVNEPQQEDLEILGRLPALRYLNLTVNRNYVKIVGGWFTGVGSFPCLERCVLDGFVGPVIFQQGAMPSLVDLELHFILPEGSEVAGSDGGFELGLGNLQSLEKIIVCVLAKREGHAASEEEVEEAKVEEAKAAVRRECEIHPNRPRLTLYG